MSVGPEYFVYPVRRKGMDHGLYPWRKLADHPTFAWAGGKTVATMIVVSLEWFPILPKDEPFLAPGHMQTAYPDYRHYTSRDYGTRVGIDRLLDAFAKVGAKVGVACNAAIAARYPSVIEAILAGGHEIIAHSTDMNGTIATGLSEDDERALIRESVSMLESLRAVGCRSRARRAGIRRACWPTQA